MNLKHLTDTQLLSDTKAVRQCERDTLTKMLHHLREVERRRLFATLKYKSLHAYAIGELGYSGDEAGRRIAALRLLKELPEIEEKIENGSLNLTNLGLAQTLFNKEKFTTAEKVAGICRVLAQQLAHALVPVVGAQLDPAISPFDHPVGSLTPSVKSLLHVPPSRTRGRESTDVTP